MSSNNPSGRGKHDHFYTTTIKAQKMKSKTVRSKYEPLYASLPSFQSSEYADQSNARSRPFLPIAGWQNSSPAFFPQIDLGTSSEVDAFKRRLGSASSCSSAPTESDATYSEEETESASDEDQASSLLGGNVPKLSLPILCEDEENPVTVRISCKKCLDMETILRNFTQMHVKAFVTCREKRDGFWEFIINWNSKLQKNLERLKLHLIGEFISLIDQAPLTEFKEDHDFRVQFSHYRLLFMHLRSMENRLSHRYEELSCPIRESYNINLVDKSLRDLQAKVVATQSVLKQLENRIRCIAKSWDNARAETNPQGFRQAIFTKEDYIFNRLSNIFICIEFLEREGSFYETKAHEISQTKKGLVLPLLQLKPRREEDQCPKPSNAKRRQQNSVKRKLPSPIAHLYPFTKPQYIRDVHTSWFRTFLRSEDVRKEISQQRDTNVRVLTDIQQLKREIHQLETQLKIKDYVNQTVKKESGELNMFPDKVSKTPSFLDYNKLF